MLVSDFFAFFFNKGWTTAAHNIEILICVKPTLVVKAGNYILGESVKYPLETHKYYMAVRTNTHLSYYLKKTLDNKRV